MKTAKTRLFRQLPFLAILAAALVGAVFLRPYLGFDALAEHRDALVGLVAAHYGFAALGFVAAYIVIVALSLPGATVATLTGGFLFGLFPGVFFNLAGATIGAILIFLAARMGLGERLAARIDASPGAVQRLKRGIDENQWSVLFLMRLVPVVPFFVANVVPALLNVPLRRFVITTALGIVPGGLVYTSVGAGLGEILEAGEQPDLGVIFEPHILGPILGLAALAALPMVLRLFRKEVRA
ncbi:TVP38/TMEM64 family protein [Sinisalibacter lacisalsi]|uniref:TVP38/TMEM64 family membrane protein n=1 Tax=Sinisalibacter lacisalsi TaxID=1526570 RepID=A0ABQ1QEH7_9RHOB|nr:TVP38/TMEM64 family protein [Sinisalibacter lacisalsi]GGD24788.1 TVP38/TMEM64 family protein [Sinisalibacter lacisalsi]